MSKFGTLVMGPAGADRKRPCFYVNLDPAAESFAFEPDLDIKDLISLDDVMDEMSLGPNGGLIYCFEFLLENLDFLTDPLEEVTEDYLIVFDMPGQIELYTHVPILPGLVKTLMHGSLNIRMCAAYLLEATFVIDRPKFFAGTLSAMSAMMLLEMPHINILSKMDLVKGQVAKQDLKRFVNVDADLIDDDPARKVASEDEQRKFVDPKATGSLMNGASFHKLNKAVAELIDGFSMVSFLKLDVQDEGSLGAVLSYIDDAIQFHESQEPKEPKEFDADGDAE
ncbi:GPN-loop GTPase [Phaeosphaeria sp. MPI-PUGE-AT-0046c]|nr:GPN-loop GTPase [Phaeosphaeria sp. MPI-PUGE-AT-0046c]